MNYLLEKVDDLNFIEVDKIYIQNNTLNLQVDKIYSQNIPNRH